jgi:hypothetical protein
MLLYNVQYALKSTTLSRTLQVLRAGHTAQRNETGCAVMISCEKVSGISVRI